MIGEAIPRGVREGQGWRICEWLEVWPYSDLHLAGRSCATAIADMVFKCLEGRDSGDYSVVADKRNSITTAKALCMSLEEVVYPASNYFERVLSVWKQGMRGVTHVPHLSGGQSGLGPHRVLQTIPYPIPSL